MLRPSASDQQDNSSRILQQHKHAQTKHSPLKRRALARQNLLRKTEDPAMLSWINKCLPGVTTNNASAGD